jgi:hypothetical protein
MSTIWTPGGEYVPKEPPEERAPSGAPPQPGAEPSSEDVEAALAEAKAVLAIPVVEHVGRHAMALFELAALHLEREAVTGEPPDLAEASLAIDAMAALVEGLGERLGRYQSMLADALAQLRLAYVEASKA